ncbi:FadR/GntR family transcriptional regulator [Streptomyces flaveolus]|uniref:FadR/GntR family transcriptional regulator n=1 Tax=Streptomyces flaveolus TaxID=67297 RepID=UPI003802949F
MTYAAQPADPVSPQFARARVPKTAEIIASNIRRQIVSRELKEGDTLPSEIDLMQQFGVSRPTLREAFRILEAESLISVRRGSRGGAQVMAPSLGVAARYVGLLLQMEGTTIGEVYEARALMEPVAAGMLAQRRTRTDVTELTRIVDELDELTAAISDWKQTASADQMRWARLSWSFHEQVVERAGNRALTVQWGVLRDVTDTHMASQLNQSWSKPPTLTTLRKSVRSYARLVKYVEAKDVASAQDHWRAHMNTAGKILAGAERSKEIVDLFE